MTATPQSDLETVQTLTRLNEQYVDAFMKGDSGWYRDHLADDFVCIESDGSVLDKGQFLRNAEAGPDVVSYALSDVRVRLFGPIALVHAKGRWTRRDGSAGTSRYTDVYRLLDGGWKAISAQITRSQDPL
jgi:ketosteroid isomerase-like protein